MMPVLSDFRSYVIQELTLDTFEILHDRILVDWDTFSIYDLIQSWADEFISLKIISQTACFADAVERFANKKIKELVSGKHPSK